MELHTIKGAEGARKNRKRVGRGHGSGNGKTSGKGHKGQKARSGFKRKPGFEGGQMPLHRRLPKRGFTQVGRWPLAVLNLGALNKAFKDGDSVTTQDIVDLHLLHPEKGGIKLLGEGELDKALHVTVQAVSESARKKIEAAGGSVTIERLKSLDSAAKPVDETAVEESPKTEDAPTTQADTAATESEAPSTTDEDLDKQE